MTYRSTLLLVFGLLALAGCQGIGGSTENRPQPVLQAPAAPSDKDESAAYYYFSSAQMKLKEGNVADAQWLMEKAVRHDPGSAALKLELAGIYLVQKEHDKALQTIQAILHDHPDEVQALVLAGRIHQQREQLPAAKEYYERALSHAPSDQNVYLYLGRIYWSENDFGAAERVFRGMVDRFPDSYAAHYFNGKVLMAQGRKEAAQKAFLRSLELEPALEEPRFELIKLYREQQGQTGAVARMYETILEYNPDNIEAAVELALLYRQEGQGPKGALLLSQLGRRSEEENGIFSYILDNYLEAKQYEPAAWVVQSLLEGAPESAELHYLAGVTYDGLKRSTEALDHLGRVPQQSRFYKNAVVFRSLLLRDAGKVDQSIAVVRSALQHDPRNIDYYMYLGMFHEELEQYAEALKVLTQGLSVDSQNVRLHFRLGVVHDKAGHKEEAIAAMKSILRIQPQDAEALNYLGYTYADLGIHLEEAENLIRSALQLKPDDGYITDSLAWVYYKQGRYEDALKWLTKAETLVPNDPVILEHLGDVNLKLNLQENALKYYLRSLEVNEKDREQLELKIRSLSHDAVPPKK